MNTLKRIFMSLLHFGVYKYISLVWDFFTFQNSTVWMFSVFLTCFTNTWVYFIHYFSLGECCHRFRRYLLIASDNFVCFLEFFKSGAAACLSYSLKRCWLHVSLGKNARNFPLPTRDESHKFINVFSQIAQCLMLDKKGENEENCKKTMSKFLPTFLRCRWEAAKIKDLKPLSFLDYISSRTSDHFFNAICTKESSDKE